MYFIAQVLPDELNKQILPWKQMMFDKYGCKVGLKSPAHITFIPPYYMNDEMQSELISDLDSFCSSQQPFLIATKNFASFKPRTIFIDVVINEQLAQLKKATDVFFKSKQYPMKFDTRPFHPHITIATRDFAKKIFFEIYPYFEKQEFEETWSADSLSLLRHNQKNWDVIHTSQFKNL
jgi:2'-5' RNA ligase